MMCDDFVDFIIKTIEENKIDTKNIRLEITESVLIKSINEIVKKIEVLNKYGIKFALDDFGTGYSSLSYLSKIPFDFIKIDKNFTDDILKENSTKDIISLIINLAKSNNIAVIAEGVEVKEQLDWLLDKKCDIAQGFYMGKPMPKDETFEILDKNMYDL